MGDRLSQEEMEVLIKKLADQPTPRHLPARQVYLLPHRPERGRPQARSALARSAFQASLVGTGRRRRLPALRLARTLSLSAEGSPFLDRPGILSGEVDRVYDPVEVPVDVVAYHHAGFACGASPQNPYAIALLVSGRLPRRFYPSTVLQIY